MALLSPERKKAIQDAVIPWLRRRLLQINAAMAKRSRLGDHPFFEADDFPWVREVEAQWRSILGELESILKNRDRIPNFADVSKDQAHLTDYGNWQTFFLYAYGHSAPENIERCPQTTAIVRRIPGMKTAFFSILNPKMKIRPHGGPYKGVLRYHLGLIVPEPRESCGIKVGGITAHWEPGRSLLFDDTYEHEAWNDSDSQRVVLFVDFERPLPIPYRWINRAIIALFRRSPLVTDGVKNQRAWTKRFGTP